MDPSAKTTYRHLLYPLLVTALFFAVALSPVELLGCKLRGLLAFMIALASGISGIVTAIMGLKGRIRGDADSFWRIISTLILTIPLIALLKLA